MELWVYTRRQGAFTLVAESAGEQGSSEQAEDVRGLKTYPDQAKIVGFLVAEARRSKGHIITIDVLPQARRFGVGSQLMSTAESRLITSKCDSVVLETAVDNTSALSFYKRHQYFVCKTLPRYYSNGVDAFVLKKDLLTSTSTS